MRSMRMVVPGARVAAVEGSKTRGGSPWPRRELRRVRLQSARRWVFARGDMGKTPGGMVAHLNGPLDG